MARTREKIAESVEELARLREEYAGTQGAKRIEFLQLLRKKPTLTLKEASARIGMSEPTINRWWSTYLRGGIEELLQVKKRGRKPSIDPETVEELRRKLHNEELETLKDVQYWLEEEEGISYSTSGTWYLLNTAVRNGPNSTGIVPGNSTYIDERLSEKNQNSGIIDDFDTPEEPYAIPLKFIEFLNKLPVDHDVTSWLIKFRTALNALFDDVDRISVSANKNCNIQDLSVEHRDPLKKTIKVAISAQSGIDEYAGKSPVLVESTKQAYAEELIDRYRKRGMPLDEYHPPKGFEYHYGGKQYIGVVVLWREKKKAPISQKTIKTMEILEPFILFALSDIVARNQKASPSDGLFTDAFSRMKTENNLSKQESRFIGLLLLGHYYIEIADMLNISLDTVGKHMSSVHRKTGTGSYTELFAKYFGLQLPT